MTNKIYIGIDIGQKGAISIIKGDRDIECYKMPMIKSSLDVPGIKDIFLLFPNCFVVFEKVGLIFGSSKKTAFSLGNQLGVFEGMCVALGFPFSMVPPKEWQREMFIGVDEITKPPKKDSKSKKPVRDTKAMALVAIRRKFPDLPLILGERSKKPHDGLVDSVLIAQYARQKKL